MHNSLPLRTSIANSTKIISVYNTGEHVYILLDVTKGGYNASEKAFNDTIKILAEFVSKTCQDNNYTLVTFDDKVYIPIRPFNSGANISKALLNTTRTNSTKRQGNLAFEKAEGFINATIIIDVDLPSITNPFAKPKIKRSLPPTSFIYVGFGKTRGMNKILGTTRRLSQLLLKATSSPWLKLIGIQPGETGFRGEPFTL